jgi:hypothetical protein
MLIDVYSCVLCQTTLSPAELDSTHSQVRNGFLHSSTERDVKKRKTQEKMERGSRMDKRAKDKLVRSLRENGGG